MKDAKGFGWVRNTVARTISSFSLSCFFSLYRVYFEKVGSGFSMSNPAPRVRNKWLCPVSVFSFSATRDSLTDQKHTETTIHTIILLLGFYYIDRRALWELWSLSLRRILYSTIWLTLLISRQVEAYANQFISRLTKTSLYLEFLEIFLLRTLRDFFQLFANFF